MPIIPLTLSSAVDRSAGEYKHLSAPVGARVSFIGVVPQDLVVTYLSAAGAPLLETMPMSGGDAVQITGTTVIIRHSAVPSGGDFLMIVSYGDDLFLPAARTVQLLLRTGKGINDVVPQRQSLGYAITNPPSGTQGASDVVSAVVGRAVRVLRYRVQISGGTYFGASGNQYLGLLEGGGGIIAQHWIGKPTAAGSAGSLFDTGLVDMGDGYLGTVGQKIYFQWGNPPAIDGAITVQCWYNLE